MSNGSSAIPFFAGISDWSDRFLAAVARLQRSRHQPEDGGGAAPALLFDIVYMISIMQCGLSANWTGH
jgi:hypothetical protein